MLLSSTKGGSPMSVKASVSMTEQQDAFIKRMVAEGRYASASAVVQQSIEMLKQETEREEAELAALRTFLQERAKGPLYSAEEFDKAIDDLIAKKRIEYGI